MESPPKIEIYKNLACLNGLTHPEARAVFYACSGSSPWADEMTAARPFVMIEPIYAAARRIWYSLSREDWVEAFNSSLGDESDDIEYARQYADKFGFSFVLFKERPDGEIPAIRRARLRNSYETEIQLAADEQYRIIESKLNDWLEA